MKRLRKPTRPDLHLPARRRKLVVDYNRLRASLPERGSLPDVALPGRLRGLTSASTQLGPRAWRSITDIVASMRDVGGFGVDDRENIKQIIEMGRTQDVEEMEIEMTREQAQGINATGGIVGLSQGTDITIGSKGKTTYVMKVKYRTDVPGSSQAADEAHPSASDSPTD